MRRRSLAACIAVVALWIAVACLDVSSPVTGIASISTIILPTPSIVVNDTMRDTSGRIDSLRVNAYAPNGTVIPPSDVVVQYTVIDSTQNLSVGSTSGLAWSKLKQPSLLAKVVAVVTPVNGKGSIQTLQVPVPIVPVPKSGLRSSDTTWVFRLNGVTADTLNSNLLSPPLNVTLYASTTDTTIQSYIVSYTILAAPDSNSTGPTVVFYNPSGNDSSTAVTNTSGVATRQLRLRPSAIANPQLSGGAVTDTVEVLVRVLYHGKPLHISPDSLFVIPIRRQLF